MAESLEERFKRLLVMAPYIIEKGGAGVDEVCTRFGISRAQLVADVGLLFVCGLPGYTPGDLIEAEIDGDRVWIREAPYFARPMRLTAAEGLVLYAGARAAAAAGVETEALQSAMAKLERAFPDGALERVEMDIAGSAAVDAVRSAIEQRRQVHLVYHAHAKDEITERDVDPWGLFMFSGRWYLVGWCHSVNDERIFRADRMKEVKILDEPAEIPEDLDLEKYAGTAYVEGPQAVRVVLDLAPEAARWVAEYYPLVERSEGTGGWVRVTISAGGMAWMEKLLLRLGKQVRVVDPPGLAALVKERACRLAERYAT